MAAQSRNNKKSASERSRDRERKKQEMKNRLEDDHNEFAKKYNKIVQEMNAENGKDSEAEVSNASEVMVNLTQGSSPNSIPVEENKITGGNDKMAELDFDEMLKDEGQKTETGKLSDQMNDLNNPGDDIPELPDDENPEVKGKEGNDQEKKSSTKNDITFDELKNNVIGDNSDRNLRQNTNGAIARLLKKNVFLKQMITNGDFARGFTMSANNRNAGKKNAHGEDMPKDNVATYRIENMKPGRAKAAIISVPRVISELLKEMESTGKNTGEHAMRFLRDRGDVQITDAGEVILTSEQSKDTVDIAMNYDALMTRVAVLMDGIIYEYGGVNGELAVENDTTGQKYQNNPQTNLGKWEDKDYSAGKVTATVGQETYVTYQMVRPKASDFDAIRTGQVDGDSREAGAVRRYMSGKAPLKRVKGAYSALYTRKNYVPTMKYAEANPFADGFTQEAAEDVSAKAVFRKRNVYSKPENGWLEKHTKNMLADDKNVLFVFDPNTNAAERYDHLLYTRDYQKLDANGKPVIQNRPKKDENGNTVKDAEGKVVREEYIPEPEPEHILSYSTPRDFFTGAPIAAADANTVTFVRYGKPGQNKKGVTAPRAQKYRVSVSGHNATVDETKGIVGVFDIDDDIYKGILGLTSKDILEEAIGIALTKTSNRSGGSGAIVDVPDDGLFGSLQSMISLPPKSAKK